MPQNESELEELKRRLYSRTNAPLPPRRHEAHEDSDADIEHDWRSLMPQTNTAMASKPHRYLKFALLASIIFFLLALGAAAYFLLGGSNVVSTSRVSIRVDGPATVDAGKPLSLAITVENGNPTPLQSADLIIEYPDGTKSAANLNLDLPRDRLSLGDVASGTSVAKTVQAVLFGQEMDQKDIKITVEYRVPGSNAVFDASKDITISIGSAPLSLSVDAVDELSSNQTINFTVTITSNSTSPIQNLLLKAEYPFGFSFGTADVAPAYSSNVWNLGDLPPGAKRTIHIAGTQTGEDNDQRVFKFSIGAQSPNDAHTISTVYTTVSHQVTLSKPFIGAELLLNGQNGEQVVMPSGTAVRATINWANNLPTGVTNLDIEAKLSGPILDPSSVSVDNGFYRSADNTIIWNKDTLGDFTAVDPGASGALSFSFSPLALGAGGASVKNPAVTIILSVRANRAGEGNVSEALSSLTTRKAVFSSALVLQSDGLYSSGPFANTGALPPVANKETTYTVRWLLSNSSNALSRVSVSATLPTYVKFLKGGSGVSYDPASGAVTWNVGSLPAGAGFGSAPREADFQVSFLPSVSQVGTTPILINQANASGSDSFAGVDVSGSAERTTIDIKADPAYKAGVGVVH